MKVLKYIFGLCFIFSSMPSFADEEALLRYAEEVAELAKTTCAGVSDEIGKVANISKANTAVTAVGTAASTGALATGIAKSKEEERIDELISQICAANGCTAEGVAGMSDEQFLRQVLHPMAEIAELQERVKKSKNLGNWRTGLMAGTVGTNLASAIMSGINIDQSELQQHISACNEVIKFMPNISNELRKAGINPNEHAIAKKMDTLSTWCSPIDTKEIEKIEKRMKGVMGTSIAGTAIGAVGVGTSAAANSSKYMDYKIVGLSEEDKRKEKALNTTANVMAGANVATGVVETGLNISLVTLTKRLMDQASRCEEVLK